jgi:hypothetical protein
VFTAMSDKNEYFAYLVVDEKKRDPPVRVITLRPGTFADSAVAIKDLHIQVMMKVHNKMSK